MSATVRPSFDVLYRGLPSRMELVVDAAHPLFEDVGIDLRRRQIRVAQHHLDRAQVGTALQEVRGKGMSQSVRAQRPCKARLLRIALQDLPETNTRQSSTAATRAHEEPHALPLS